MPYKGVDVIIAVFTHDHNPLIVHIHLRYERCVRSILAYNNMSQIINFPEAEISILPCSLFSLMNFLVLHVLDLLDIKRELIGNLYYADVRKK